MGPHKPGYPHGNGHGGENNGPNGGDYSDHTSGKHDSDLASTGASPGVGLMVAIGALLLVLGGLFLVLARKRFGWRGLRRGSE